MEREGKPLNENPSTSDKSIEEETNVKTFPFDVENGVMLIRMVPEKFIRSDNTITSDAYRPKPKPIEISNTGYEKNVSTAPKSCFENEEDLTRYNSRRKHKLYEMDSVYPNSNKYLCVQDKECHIGITGDMTILAKDEQTLEDLANNSNLLFPK